MKGFRFNLLATAALPLAAAALLSLHSCDHFRRGGAGEEVADTLAFCTVLYEDTTSVLTASVSQKMQADFPEPEAEGPLADSLRAWVTDLVYTSCYPLWGDEPNGLPNITYAVGHEQEYLDACARAGLAMMTDEVRQMAEDGWALGYENDFSLSMALQTAAYVSYEQGHYTYTGGAHGGYAFAGSTFRRSDGSRLGWRLIDPTKHADLVELIKQELCVYFAEGNSASPLSEDELMENLILWDDPETPENELRYGIPLPAAEPWVSRDGVSFVYQQYEIAAYAAGLPSCTIPFERIRPCLSQEGRELLGLE